MVSGKVSGMALGNSHLKELIKPITMKTIIISLILCITIQSVRAQQDTTKKEYLIKYEVLTKKGEKIGIGYFDKNEVNAGGTASELWSYTFTTINKNQNIQIFTVGGQSSRTRKGAKVWTKVNIYVNGNLIKSVEEKVEGLGSTVQVNLNDLK